MYFLPVPFYAIDDDHNRSGLHEAFFSDILSRMEHRSNTLEVVIKQDIALVCRYNICNNKTHIHVFHLIRASATWRTIAEQLLCSIQVEKTKNTTTITQTHRQRQTVQLFDASLYIVYSVFVFSVSLVLPHIFVYRSIPTLLIVFSALRCAYTSHIVIAINTTAI